MATNLKEEENDGATCTSTTDGLLSSCLPAILRMKTYSINDDDGEVYHKANPVEPTSEEQLMIPQQQNQKQNVSTDQGPSQATVTADQGGNQATVTAELIHERNEGGKPTVQSDVDSDDEEDMKFVYPINQHCPGVAILIGNSNFDTGESARKGAAMDLRTSYEVFQRLGFKVRSVWNAEVVILLQKLKDLAMSEDVMQSDCLVCVISTHGSESEVAKREKDPTLPASVKVYEHYLSLKNGIVKTRDILHIFDDSHCKGLRGKPKLFFIQACRSRANKTLLEGMDPGILVDVVVPVLRPLPGNTADFMSRAGSATDDQITRKPESEVDTRGEMPQILERDGKMYYEYTPPFPVYEDIVEVVPPVCLNNFLVMFASPSAMLAWSENDEGGWLLSAMYKEFLVLIRRGKRFSLLPALVNVSRRITLDSESCVNDLQYDKMKSVPSIEHKLTKDVYFTPQK